jgi:hypothetical protein
VLEDFDVVWSGTQQRKGECKPLSSYTGRSPLANAKRKGGPAIEPWDMGPIV